MNISDIPKWLGITVALLGAASSYAVADYKIDENKKDIEELKQDKEQQIRMEERQKQIKEDVKAIKDILEELKRARQ